MSKTISIITPKSFSLISKINEITHKNRTSDIKKTILGLKPEFVYTDTYFTLSSGSGKSKITTERKLSLLQSKRLFNNEDVLDVFIQNLTQEYA